MRPRLLVVGGASLDQIHVDGEPCPTPGGAGLYTALAAVRAGADVTMLGPVPDPMPAVLAPALERIRWVGPKVSIDGLPRFEIAYDGRGDVTLFREHLGAEPDMTPALLDGIDDLPEAAYCVPFLDARLQHDFIRELARRGCRTVASTYGKAVRDETDVVRETARLVDLFFCNEDEARVLFGGVDHAAPVAGRFRFVTRGAAGAAVFQGEHRTDVAGVRVEALDPTGAGDTFCGTTVARLLAGDHPVVAARRGTAAAAEMVTMLGPAALWSPEPSPLPLLDRRVAVDNDAVDRLAARLAVLPEIQPFDFTGDLFPPVGTPGAVDWWFAATLQQYGFWYDDGVRYTRPMVAPIGGVERKGSDYLWAQYLRAWNADATATSIEVQAAMDSSQWAAWAVDDSGRDPYPDAQTRAASGAAYGTTMLALGATPSSLVAEAAQSARPVRTLLALLDHVGGYREDPLRKKSALLAVILQQRPEHFLPIVDGDDVPPIVDYHVQRTALRTGIVVVTDPDLRDAIAGRRLVAAVDEAAVREAAFDAVGRLASRSGKPMGAVDWFLFQMRHRCPEMDAPRCTECPADPVCAKAFELFQPVLRTTAY